MSKSSQKIVKTNNEKSLRNVKNWCKFLENQELKKKSWEILEKCCTGLLTVNLGLCNFLTHVCEMGNA